MNQSGNRNLILGWVKNLKRNATLSDSVDEIHDDLSVSESRSPSRSSFQSGPVPFPASPTKERAIPQAHALGSNMSHNGLSSASASEFLRPFLSHKSRSTNNVNNSRSDSILITPSNQDSGSGLRQRRDSFLQNNPLVDENSKYFGVPLADAIKQAAAKISILGPVSKDDCDDDVLHYGKIPIVVAKCGVYLKRNGLNVEGIFRVGGSSKRIKELQIIFNSPPDFGKRLSWDGFTVHDAASVLRRYLNALPEPLIPLELYEDFRDPLRSRPRIIKYLKYKADNSVKLARKTATSNDPDISVGPKNENPTQAQNEPQQTINSGSKSEGRDSSSKHEETPVAQKKSDMHSTKRPKSYKSLTRDVYGAIDDYKKLLDELPSLSKQLLFYILDLLAMVQSFSSENLMSSRNLAAIFQPSILLHPSHDMDPEEYALSQSVVEFLIQYSYKLLPNSEAKPDMSSSASVESSKQAENKSALRVPPRRPHSKSLSSPNHDLEFIGFRSSVKPSRSFALSDTDHDFASASSDDEEDFNQQLQSNLQSNFQTLTLRHPSQRNDVTVRDSEMQHNVPQVVFDKAN